MPSQDQPPLLEVRPRRPDFNFGREAMGRQTTHVCLHFPWLQGAVRSRDCVFAHVQRQRELQDLLDGVVVILPPTEGGPDSFNNADFRW